MPYTAKIQALEALLSRLNSPHADFETLKKEASALDVPGALSARSLPELSLRIRRKLMQLRVNQRHAAILERGKPAPSKGKGGRS